jgi:hypothetical protein
MTRSPLFRISPHLEIAPEASGIIQALYMPESVFNFTEHQSRPASSFIKHNFGPRVITYPDQHPIPTSNPYRHCTRTAVYYPRITILSQTDNNLLASRRRPCLAPPNTAIAAEYPSQSPTTTHLRICPSPRVDISAAIPT